MKPSMPSRSTHLPEMGSTFISSAPALRARCGSPAATHRLGRSPAAFWLSNSRRAASAPGKAVGASIGTWKNGVPDARRPSDISAARDVCVQRAVQLKREQADSARIAGAGDLVGRRHHHPCLLASEGAAQTCHSWQFSDYEQLAQEMTIYLNSAGASAPM